MARIRIAYVLSVCLSTLSCDGVGPVQLAPPPHDDGMVLPAPSSPPQPSSPRPRPKPAPPELRALPVYGGGTRCTIVDGVAPQDSFVVVTPGPDCQGVNDSRYAYVEGSGRFRLPMCLRNEAGQVSARTTAGASTTASDCTASPIVRHPVPGPQDPAPRPRLAPGARERGCITLDGSAAPGSLVEVFEDDACRGFALAWVLASDGGRFAFSWCGRAVKQLVLSVSASRAGEAPTCGDDVWVYTPDADTLDVRPRATLPVGTSDGVPDLRFGEVTAVPLTPEGEAVPPWQQAD